MRGGRVTPHFGERVGRYGYGGCRAEGRILGSVVRRGFAIMAVYSLSTFLIPF